MCKMNINKATALGSAILALSALESKYPHELVIDIGIKKHLVEKVNGVKVDKYKKPYFIRALGVPSIFHACLPSIIDNISLLE